MKIIGIFPGSQYFFFGVQPLNTAAQFPALFALFRNDAGFQYLGRQFYRRDDFYISGTAAVIVPQGVADFFFVGVRVFVQQRLGTHNHARNTEAALYGPCFRIGKSIHFFFSVGKSFYRNHRFSL